MGRRRDGREAAVQFLFGRDLRGDFGAEEFDSFFGLRIAKDDTRNYAMELATGVLENLEPIDARIRARLENFQLERLSVVDRNVLRLAVYEMFHSEDVPPVVAINEAIEISKRFGTEESGRFVNGVLDKLKEEITRPLR